MEGADFKVAESEVSNSGEYQERLRESAETQGTPTRASSRDVAFRPASAVPSPLSEARGNDTSTDDHSEVSDATYLLNAMREIPSSPVHPPAPAELNMSSMAGAPSVADIDIDTLSYEIEDHCRGLKKTIVERFLEMKKKLILHQRGSLEAERNHGLARVAHKQEEIEMLKDQLLQHKKRLGTCGVQLERSCALLAKRADLIADWKIGSASWFAWKVAVKKGKRAKHLVRTLVPMHYATALQKSVFDCWRDASRELWRTNTAAKHKMALTDTELAQRKHYEGIIATLQSELAEARGGLEYEERTRAALEENMKQAFMRGVCALNIEAMSVIKRTGGGPAGPPGPPGFPTGGGPPAPSPMDPEDTGPGGFEQAQDGYRGAHDAGFVSGREDFDGRVNEHGYHPPAAHLSAMAQGEKTTDLKFRSPTLECLELKGNT
ncbi:hypothetical protein CYMTET_30930 [Cymbomonas tetramitiformis]|uniref:Centrosomal protein POC5 n=1 Tax=Cymbomonas tetramitiformis TaxID=36881 RepID=A0AAE0FI89_9CHLO|nr:hypothetical protein CYMTET_30930 [Cymbomonas tetramitiformis]